MLEQDVGPTLPPYTKVRLRPLKGCYVGSWGAGSTQTIVFNPRAVADGLLRHNDISMPFNLHEIHKARRKLRYKWHCE